MYIVLWEFQVRADQTSQFEQAYGPQGAWAQLFQKDPEYVGTQLLRDLKKPGRYLTVDTWTRKEAYEGFGEQWRSEYQALDQKCEALTEQEAWLGYFTSVDAGPAARDGDRGPGNTTDAGGAG